MTETIEIQIEDCYPDYAGDREPSIPSLDELSEEDEVMIEMTKDIEKSKYLRERAEKRLNEGDLPEAKKLLWISAERKYMQDRNELDEFAFHQMCWDRLSEGWMEPV